MTTNNSNTVVEVDTWSFASSSSSLSSSSSSSSTAVPNSSIVLWNGGCDEASLLPGQTCVLYDQRWLTELNFTNASFSEVEWEEGIWPGRGAAGLTVEEGLSWRVLFLLLFVFVGITGNSLVCIAISVERKLQNVTNYFLMSLAVADLFVSLVVMPCCIVQEFMGYWPFDQVMCNIWQVSDVVMCTSSIMHMCTISMDRYSGIHDPLRSRNKSRSAVCVRIAAVWLTSMAIASPLVALGAVQPEQILSDARQCAIFNAYYLVYGSLAAFFGPLLIMLVAFSLTVRLLNQQTRQLGLRRCKAERRPGKGPGAQFEMRLIAPLGLTTAIAGNRLEVIQPPGPPSDEDDDDSDDSSYRSRKSRKKSLRWNVDGQDVGGPPRCALAELMATNLPSERDKNNERRRSMMQRTPGAVLKAMAMKYRSQPVDGDAVFRPTAASTHKQGKRTGGRGEGGGGEGLKNTTTSNSFRRRSSGFLRLKHCTRELHLPQPKSLRDYDLELATPESYSAAEAPPNTFPDSISKDNESSPLLRRANSRRKRHSQVVLLRLKPLRDSPKAGHRFPSSTAVTDSVTSSNPLLPSLGTTESLKTLPRSSSDKVACITRANESLERLSESCCPFDDDEQFHDSLGSERVEDERQPLFSVVESDNETEEPTQRQTERDTPTPSRQSTLTERYDERAKHADRAKVSPVRSRSEIFLRDLARTRCFYRKSFCSRDELTDAAQLMMLLPSQTTCSVGSEDSDPVLVTAGYDRFISDAATDRETTDSTTGSLVGRPTEFNRGHRCNEEDSNGYPDDHQSTIKLDMADDFDDKKVSSFGGGNEKRRKSANNSTDEILTSQDPPVTANDEETTVTTTTTAMATTTATTEDGTVKSKAVGSAAARVKFKSLVQKHGAAFQMAGMLAAKREESRKSEVNTVKTERKAIKVLGTMFALFCLSWTPFFSTNLAMGLCQTCHIDTLLFKVFLWLGYASSTLNPIIYTVFNRAFRTTFIRLIKCGRQCVLPEFLRSRARHLVTEGKENGGGGGGAAVATAHPDCRTAANGALLERLRISRWMSKLTKEAGESNL